MSMSKANQTSDPALSQSSDPVERDQPTQSADGVPVYKNHSVTDPDPFAERTSAADTLTGATSADVHNGLGHPGQGQSSAEQRHNGQKGRKKYGAGGAEQWGTTQKQNMKVHPDERQRDFETDTVE